jgi:hypothetical protein
MSRWMNKLSKKTRSRLVLTVTAVMIAAVFIGAHFGQTQKTIINPGMIKELTKSE